MKRTPSPLTRWTRRSLLLFGLTAMLGLCLKLQAMPTAHSNGVQLSGGTVTRCTPLTVCATPDSSGHLGRDALAWDIGDAAKYGCEVDTNGPCLTFRAGAQPLKSGSFTVKVILTWECWRPPPEGPCGSGPVEASATIEVVGDEDAPDDAGGCAACADGDIGSGLLKNDSIDFRLSLGAALRDSNGQFKSAGYLWLKAESPSASLATPGMLRMPYHRAGVTRFPADEGQPVQQVKTPEGLVNMSPLTNGYVLGIYYNDQVAAGTTNGYTLISNAAPFVTWTVQQPSGDTNSLRVTENRQGLERTHLYTSQAAGSAAAWRLDRPDGSYGISQTVPGTNGYAKTWELHNADGSLARKTVKTYANYTIQTNTVGLVTETVEGDGAATATTICSYYTNDPWTGLVRRIVYPDGNWVYYTYDAAARKANEYAAYNNSPAPAPDQEPDPAAIGCKLTQYAYNGPDQMKYAPSQTTVFLPADNGDGSYTLAQASASDNRTYVGGYLAQSVVTDGVGLSTSTDYITDPGDAFVGFAESIAYPDGRAAYFTYSLDTNGITTTTEQVGKPDNGGGILNGQQIQTKTDNLGRAVSRTVNWIAQAAVGVELSRRTNAYAAVGRDYSTVDLISGLATSYHYDCCGLASMTDPDGVVTRYEYDALRRRVSEEVLHGGTAGLKTTNLLDAAGNVLARRQIGTNGTDLIRLQTTRYDVLGRPLLVTNALNGVAATEYSTSNGRRREVIVYPDQGFQTNDYYLDGRLAAVTGTAVASKLYHYGVESSSAREYTLETSPSASGGTDEWVKTYTDAARRQVQTDYPGGVSSQTIYNELGQLSEQIDPDGVTQLFEYNGKGELEFSATAMNGNSQIDFANDRVQQTEAGAGPATLNAAVNVRRSLQSIYPHSGDSTAVVISTNEVSTDGLTTWSFTPSGLSVSQTAYAPNGWRYTTNTAPDGSRTIQTYQYSLLRSFVRLDAVSQQLAAVTYAYDSFYRIKTATDARNGATTYTYNLAGLVEAIATPAPSIGQAAQTTTTYYDNCLRPQYIVQPDGTVLTNRFHANGLNQLVSGSRTYPAGYSYDAQGRLQTMTNWSSFPSGGARVTTWNYDLQRGWLTSKTYEGEAPGPSYGYTAAARLQTRLWARGTNTTYSYSGAGDLGTVTYSDATPGLSYGLDRLGHQTTITQGNTTATRLFDPSGNLLSESYAGGPLDGLTVTNSYDGLLRRTNLSLFGPAGQVLASTSYAYDSASGRLQAETDGTNSATYVYLTNSALVGQVVFAHNGALRMTATKQHDFLNRLTSISSASGASAIGYSYGYNRANQRTNVTLTDSSRWTYGYDGLGQVTSGKKLWTDGNPVAGQQFEYAFDDIGNRLTAAFGGDNAGQNLRTAHYTNNLLNQITSREVPGFLQVLGSAASNATVTLWSDNGSYSRASRHGDYFRGELSVNNTAAPGWLTITNLAVLQNGTNADYVTSTTGGVLVAQSPELFAHDADGNLTNDGRWTYTWDAENRLVAMESKAGIPPAAQQRLEFAYDWQGRRIQKVVYINDGSGYAASYTNKFVYDGWNLLARLDGGGNLLQSYVWGTDLSGTLQGAGGVGGLLAITDYQPGTAGTYFPAFDGNGNVIALVRAADGALAAQYDYGPFGEVIRATGPMAKANPFRFSTKYQDNETDLLYYGYRYYNANTGRWNGRDPLGERGGLNVYGFVLNEPSSHYDALGHEALPEPEPPAYRPPIRILPTPEPAPPGRIIPFPRIPPVGLPPAVPVCYVVGGVVVCGAACVVIGGIRHCPPSPVIYPGYPVNAPPKKASCCQQCRPYRAGTVAYQVHTGHTHWPYGDPHLRLWRVHQNPRTCKCYWNDNDPANANPPPLSDWVHAGPPGTPLPILTP